MKLGDMTLREVAEVCKTHEYCSECDLNTRNGFDCDFCNFYDDDLDKEVPYVRTIRPSEESST